MNKNAIQKYAIWARNELIEQVKQRAYQYGISAKGYGDENATVIAGRVLSADEKRQRAAFVSEIKKHGYQEAVEEVAYTWFNRFVALRFMEINDYLPTHVRVFSDASGGFNPEILKDVLHLELEGLDKSKVSEMLNANQTEELYRYLLLTQCNALNAALPEMFEKLGSYTEMLLPNNILKQESVLAHLVKDIDEDDWKDAVQIIGWMYQYYNTEPKQAVFDGLKKNVKITKEKIPAATQLFTPDWIVRYMVENSLGRLWLESHPNPTLKANWKYYLDEAEQTPEVTEKLRVMRSQSPVKSPEDIRLIDPCMGSGHILVYAFDVLMQIYESEGYNPRDAAKLILEKNVYGLDIDCRAYQLAYFSLMMKARQYNRRIFTDGVKPQVYYPAGWSDGEEYGSLAKVDTLPPMPELPKDQLTLFDGVYDIKLNAWNFKRLLAQKYDVVVTNPPYRETTGCSKTLIDYCNKEHPISKSDLYSVFIEYCPSLLNDNGLVALVTPQSWLSLSSFKNLRKKLIVENSFCSMLMLTTQTFESGLQAVSYVAYKNKVEGYKSSFVEQNESFSIKAPFENESSRIYRKNQDSFSATEGCQFMYDASEKMLNILKNGEKIEKFAVAKPGMQTSDNERFLRYWFEVCYSMIGFELTHDGAINSDYKWFPYNKGIGFRKWFGNNDYVVNFYNDGEELKYWLTHNPKDPSTKSWSRNLRNYSFYFNDGVTFTAIGQQFSSRLNGKGYLFDTKGPMIFGKHLKYICAFTNTVVFSSYNKAFCKQATKSFDSVNQVPLIISNEIVVEKNTIENKLLSKQDWDSFETSWGFLCHPLINNERIIAKAFTKWEHEAADRFDTLKANEEELNRIFIEIYGLQDELTPEVHDKDVTVRRADLSREIRSLISYAVGCMFGRYSLDTEGLAYAGGEWNAGGEWDAGKYRSFIPDRDNILPICDDEYFDDDILGRFVDFVRVVYGADTLEENLKYIADALGAKGTPREVIRNYFLNDFYKDHCKIYQKRPIYWLFDSGKKNGFKSLIYLHRYQSDLLAKLRTDYVHEQQERYRTQLSHIAAALNTATGSERARLLKQQNKLSEQLKEITTFEEKVHHLADQNIEIDLDDGVKKNYEIFTDVLAKI